MGSTFTLPLPAYSLAQQLLAPVLMHNDRLRTAFVLVRVDLTPLSARAARQLEQTWQQCLEVLQRCVYFDKDLVFACDGNIQRGGDAFRCGLNRYAASGNHDRGAFVNNWSACRTSKANAASASWLLPLSFPQLSPASRWISRSKPLPTM